MPVKGGGGGGTYSFKKGTRFSSGKTSGSYINTYGVWGEVIVFTIPNDSAILGGLVSVNFDYRVQYASGGSFFAVYKNGVQVGSAIESALSTFVTATVDISAKKGDRISIYCNTGPATGTLYLQNCEITYDLTPYVPNPFVQIGA